MTGDGPFEERPHFVAGYGVDRSKTDQMVGWSGVVDRFALSRNYWLATSGGDGHPHVAPVWGVWLDGAFYFSTDPHSSKARNMAANPRVVVHLESGDDVVMLNGHVARVDASAEWEAMAERYKQKYGMRPDAVPGAAVYRVRPDGGFAWHEKDFPATATRYRFR